MRYIKLTQGQKAIVDDEDYDWLSGYKWFALYYLSVKSFRAVRGTWDGKKKRTILMHRIILNAPQGKQVDHINHDTLDNRKNNLRIVTSQQNHFNRRSDRNTSSRYKGVSWNKNKHKWKAYIARGGKSYHLGCFKNEKTAALAYDKAALKLFGEYALINFPEESIKVEIA